MTQDGKQPRVLLVEDSHTQAVAVARILEQAGYGISFARTGIEAIQLVAQKRPDLVLSDVEMPEMDGLELCRRLKAEPHTRSIPIVLLTKLDRMTDILSALEAGADNYVTKPINADVLLARLGRADHGRGGGLPVPVPDADAPAQADTAMLERSQVVDLLGATAQKLEHELTTVSEMAATLALEHDLDRLLARFTQRVRDLADADGVTVILRNESGWTVAAAETDEIAARTEFPSAGLGDESLPLEIAALARPEPLEIRYPEPRTSDALRALAARQGLTRLYTWPMVREGELIGHVVIVYRADRELGADEQRRFRHLADQAAVAVANARAFERERSLSRQLEQALVVERDVHRDAIFMVAAAAEARDGLTGRHLRRVQAYTEALARELGLEVSEIEEIGYSSVLHDIGKLLVRESVLGKPGKLTDDEWVEMRRHSELGAELLAVRESFATAALIALHHHERWDGTGYPHGLSRDDIPLAARITSVGDVFDALVTRRSYKEAWPAEEAAAMILSLSGSQFDPAVVDAFARVWQSGEIEAIRQRIGEA